MDSTLHALAIFLVFLHAHPVWSVFALVGFATLITVMQFVFPIWKKLWGLLFFLFLVFMLNLFAGHLVRNPLLKKIGSPGEGMIVAQSQTNTRYNDKTVLRFDVMIKGKQAKPVATYCESADFNITPEPHEDGYIWPATGKKFNVRYLPEYPQAFVIISDDNSEYSTSLKCGRSADQQRKLRAQLSMDAGNSQYQQELADAMQNYYYTLDCVQLKSNAVYMKGIDAEIAKLRRKAQH